MGARPILTAKITIAIDTMLNGVLRKRWRLFNGLFDDKYAQNSNCRICHVCRTQIWRKKVETRKNSSRMRTARLPTVHVTSEVNKFEQISSDDHQMSVERIGYTGPMSRGGGGYPGPMFGGEGVSCHVTYPMTWIPYLPSTPAGRHTPVKTLPSPNKCVICGMLSFQSNRRLVQYVSHAILGGSEVLRRNVQGNVTVLLLLYNQLVLLYIYPVRF